ncbi:protein with DOMON-like ligand-binding domain protein [Winogradskyella aurantia]|uniref:Protein with DOMON-like ligand-binding domain protein n=1 Tax=Winogradskyella aurantia TaxID=1915063 RepID=A0A265UUJ0_9FLAO|nr:protein with DOMON-like ligand-binding domain protein [Winogradskyella aurantia]
MCWVILLFSIISPFNKGNAQNKKALHVGRAKKAPKIDGNLNDEVWQNAEIATGFIQFEPDIGNIRPEHERTEVKITYNDRAIYVAAYLYDDPDKIMKQLTARDDFGQSDFFRVVLNPNNDSQNDTEFTVFSSGQQSDAIANPSIGTDRSWNAVWRSAVKIVKDGWTVEIEIPYRTLRFPEQDNPIWGLQLHRNFRRERAQYSWNPIDPTKGNVGLYHGELIGLNNLKPPIRLNLYPFSTGIVNDFDGKTTTDLTFGMDVKYGITDNFTLDATLVPDFSQAGFDNIVLNLGPFEQTFAEQRQFFTEGVDLFSKGGLFFSRRVGNAPSGDVELVENEVLNQPDEVKVLNAVKVSGRTKKGLGIGFFNAITEKTFGTITDTLTGNERSVVVEPFANYNILVVDQQFNGNSAVSLINTNVTRNGEFRDANATALVANLVNRRNTYRIDTELRMSNVNYQNEGWESGFSTFFRAAKVHGNLRYGFAHRFADTKYNINDLGLNLRNNQNDFETDVSYQIFKPRGKLNSYRINGFFNYRRLVDPNVYARMNFGSTYRATTRKLDSYGFRLNIEPGKQYDYFESRDGRFFIYENFISTGANVSTNYNRTFAIDLRANIGTLFETGRDLFTYDFEIEPRVRVNDHLLLIYQLNFDYRNGDRGYATSENDEAIFGERNRQRVTNSLRGNYNFNPFHSLGLTFRHYWDTVAYDDELFTLLDNGRLTTDSGYTVDNVSDNPNINFSTWNIDLNYSWQFVQGSFLTFLYRNQLFSNDENVEDNFTDSLDLLFNQPVQHTFSLRLQYFIDYRGIKSIFKKNKKAS